MRNWNLLLLLLPSLMVGCTTTYTPMPGEPTARLRLVYPARAPGSYVYAVSALDTCPAKSVKVAGGPVIDAPGRLGMPQAPADGSRTYTEVLIPANKPLGVWAGSIRATGQKQISCDIGFRFDPKAGTDYELEYIYPPTEQRCAVVMKSMSKGATNWRRETGLRPAPAAFSGYDFCAVP